MLSRVGLQRSSTALVASLFVLTACGGGDGGGSESPTGPTNSSPSASISSPSDGSAHEAGQAVTFTGSASDPEDGSLSGDALVWESDVDGQIGTGENVTNSGLAADSHTITLTVTDSDGATATDSITLTVSQPPTATITAPSDSSIYGQNDTISFSGSADDPEDGPLSGNNLVWRSDVDGQFGTDSTVSTSSLSSARHLITLTATDSDGTSDVDTVSIGIDGPPSATILTPDDESARDQGTSVTFGGSATDPLAGSLPDSAVEWTSDVDGALGTGDTISTSSLTAGPHSIALTATDSDGNTAADSIRMVVEAPGLNFRLRFIDSFTAAERDTIRSALQPWIKAITGDLSPFFPSSEQANNCLVTEKGVDDIVLAVEIKNLDGQGGTLAQASPCLARTDGSGNYTTAISGIVTVDDADRDNPDLGQIITHEVGHALGIGIDGLHGWGSNANDLNTKDPYFTGQNTVTAFKDLTGSSAYLDVGVPLANTGGQGTAGAHWREMNFNTELMTGLIDPGVDMPISRVSIASLADIGYSVDMTASDPFSMPMPQRALWLTEADATISAPASSGENFGTPSGAIIDSVLVTGSNAGQYWTLDPESDVFAGLLRFDVASSLPSGVTVDSAKIRLEVAGRYVGTSSHPVGLFTVTSQWAEDSVTWDSSPSAQDTAVLGFDYQYCNSCLLGNSQLTQLTTDWIDGTQSNHGLLIWAPDATTDSTFSVGFYSRHSGSPALRPQLQVDASTTTSAIVTGEQESSTGETIPLVNDIRPGKVYGVDSEGRTIRVVPVRGEGLRPRK